MTIETKIAKAIKFEYLIVGVHMRISLTAVLLVLLGCQQITGSENVDLPENDPFPSFESLRSPVLTPRDAKITISPQGHFLMNGEARYLPGVIFYEGVDKEMSLRNTGYPDSLRWLYDNILDYQGAQRVGFDAVGIFTPTRWMGKYLNGRVFDVEKSQYKRCFDSNLPLYVDFTCAGWCHGGLSPKNCSTLPQEAFTPGGQFFPYSLINPQGRNLWLEIWRDGADFIVNACGAKPMYYELFNEPCYKDESPLARAEFVRRLQEKYAGNIAKLNKAWHTNYPDFTAIGGFKRTTDNPSLRVEWLLFMQDLFYEICRDGIKAIREIDKRPDAGFCYQALFLRTGEINMYRTNKLMNRISSSTGGGDLVQAHCLRAMADGKPISDGEMYVGTTRDSVRNAYMRQYARGFNASFIFKWCKRANDWRPVYKEELDDNGKPKKDKTGKPVYIPLKDKNGNLVVDENGKTQYVIDMEKTVARAKSCAEAFPYMLLNPYGVPSSALLGIVDAKRDICDSNFLFAPRDRGVKREIAFLYSYPSDNIAVALGHTCNMLFNSYMTALDYAHVPLDVVFEEQLLEARQDRYKIIVAAGVDTVYDETPAYLKKYVENGGILVLGQETMERAPLTWIRENADFPGIKTGSEIQYSETMSFNYEGETYRAALYKKTSPDATWTSLASINQSPVFFEKRFGKGKVLFLNAKMPLEDLGRLLSSIAAKSGIFPVCRTDEVQASATVSGIEAIKAVRDGFTGYMLIYNGLGAKLVKFTPPEKLTFCQILHSDETAPRKILEDRDGAYILRMNPGSAVLLVGAEQKSLIGKYGEMPVLPFDEALESGLKWAEKSMSEKTKAKAFAVDANRIKPLDLRKQANRSFVDTVAGDGKGGWTDQGANSLTGTDWGIQDCNGIPMDFIRIDQNNGNTCVVLASNNISNVPAEVNDIRVDMKVRNLYFLHATAFSGGHSFSYIVHYADGETLEIPIRDWTEVGDWYRAGKKLPSTMTAFCGWTNSEGKGLYIWKWENPKPYKSVNSIDIVSQNGKSIPIIVAISAEEADGTEISKDTLANSNSLLPMTETNGGFEVSQGTDDSLLIKLVEGAPRTSRLTLKLPKEYDLPPDFSSAVLEFDIRAIQDSLPVMRLCVSSPIQGQSVTLNEFIAKIPDSPWMRVTVPLSRLLSSSPFKIASLSIQPNSGLEKSARFEMRELCILKSKASFAGNIRYGAVCACPWNHKQMNTFTMDDALVFQFSEKATSWMGGQISFSPAILFDSKILENKDASVKFKLRSAPNQWGNCSTVPGLQIALGGLDAEGNQMWSKYARVLCDNSDISPLLWTEASVPLRSFKGLDLKKLRALNGINIQVQNIKVDSSGFQIKDIQIK